MNIYAEQLTLALQTSGRPALEAQEFTVELPQLPTRFRNLSRFVGRYIKYPWRMQRARGQVNHVTDHSYGFLTYFLPRQSCVVTCHDLTPILIQSPSWQVRLKRQLWRIALSGTLRASFIIADSQNTKSDILKHSRYPADRIEVIYPGLEEDFRLPDNPARQVEWQAAFRQQHGLGQAVIILHVGRYSPRKNFEGVLRTFAALKAQLDAPPLHLLQVGGTFTEQHRQLIDQLGIREAVSQLSFVEREELPAIYNLASALLFPSYYEGFGWPPLEAMACGTPVVAANVSSIPEVVGPAALTFGPDDHLGMAQALHELLTDQALRSHMVALGLERVKCFSWLQCASQVYEVYQRVVETRKASANV